MCLCQYDEEGSDVSKVLNLSVKVVLLFACTMTFSSSTSVLRMAFISCSQVIPAEDLEHRGPGTTGHPGGRPGRM